MAGLGEQDAAERLDGLMERLHRLERLTLGSDRTPNALFRQVAKEEGGLIRSVAGLTRSSAAVLDAASQSILLEQRLSALENTLLFSAESRLEAVLGVEGSVQSVVENMNKVQQLLPFSNSIQPQSIQQSAQNLQSLMNQHATHSLEAAELQQRTVALANSYAALMQHLNLQFTTWNQMIESQKADG
eukprot:TRINITY_DN6667_c0_g1_i1.p1 TRINITY_DN6667_c0_g1~~TRINITY_DN6667_c0_g1_i1.p1  ORF type:complete len:187 (-),score=37.59 TRINITY_DN6667_c0_g1_i1:136-696(-)